jgi:hypothetical protein
MEEIINVFQIWILTKKKKHNYLLQLDDELISSLYHWETKGLKASEWKENNGLQLAHKYQIKEIFWDDEAITETTIYRKRIWSGLDEYDGNIKSKCIQSNIKFKKEILLRELEPEIDKFKRSLEEDLFKSDASDTTSVR